MQFDPKVKTPQKILRIFYVCKISLLRDCLPFPRKVSFSSVTQRFYRIMFFLAIKSCKKKGIPSFICHIGKQVTFSAACCMFIIMQGYFEWIWLLSCINLLFDYEYPHLSTKKCQKCSCMATEVARPIEKLESFTGWQMKNN